MYIPGRLRTASRPFRTWICPAVYSLCCDTGFSGISLAIVCAGEREQFDRFLIPSPAPDVPPDGRVNRFRETPFQGRLVLGHDEPDSLDFPAVSTRVQLFQDLGFH